MVRTAEEVFQPRFRSCLRNLPRQARPSIRGAEPEEVLRKPWERRFRLKEQTPGFRSLDSVFGFPFSVFGYGIGFRVDETVN
jgi:hypothetical protein